MKCYKITDENDKTYENVKTYRWGKEVGHIASGKKSFPYEDRIYCSYDPLVAVLLNLGRGKYDLQKAYLWLCEARGEIEDGHGMDFHATEVWSLKRVPLVRVAKEQMIRFGILCVLEVCKKKKFVAWAKALLSGKKMDMDKEDAEEFCCSFQDYTNHASMAASHLICTYYELNAPLMLESYHEVKPGDVSGAVGQACVASTPEEINLPELAKRAIWEAR